VKNRFKVVAWHGEGNSIFRVIDTKTGRAKGETSLRRDGGSARELADIQARALNRRAGARENPRGRKRNPSGVSLAYWLEAHPKVFSKPFGKQGAIQVFSTDPVLWRLSDHVVSSTASGPSVILVPRINTNPAQRIRSTRRRPVLGQKRLRGRARVSMQGGTLGDANFHAVQVKRGAAWTTLAGFPRGEFGKARATEYGKLLARRYPRQQFRVFWPDAVRKNPAPQLVEGEPLIETGRQAGALGYHVFVDGRYDADISPSKTSKQALAKALRVYPKISKVSSEPDSNNSGQRLYSYRSGDRKKNPAPRVRADGAEVERAAKLFTAFTGHRVTKMRQVSVPPVKVGLAVGPVLEIAYETTRDGKRENYLHKFRRGARPLLAASQDGRTLMLLGGGHRFTPRGIVDRR
jgi:hypothetical protein